MSKKKKSLVPVDSVSLENTTSSEKKGKKKGKSKFVQKILSKCYGIMFKPVFVFIRKQIADLLDDVNESIIQKVTAGMFLFFSGLMAYAVFIGLGLLAAAALVDFAHWSWFKAIIVVSPFYLILMIVTLIIGNALLHKPLLPTPPKEDNKEDK